MAIAQRSAPMPSSVRSCDGIVVFGYAAFAVVALVAIYFSSGGPSFTGADLSVMAMM
jgi:hypothetical protein